MSNVPGFGPENPQTTFVALSEMPKVNPRRPFCDKNPNGYQESFRDWTENNMEAVEWFLENHEAIKVKIEGTKFKLNKDFSSTVYL